MINLHSKDEEIIYYLHEINKGIMPKFERCTGVSQSRLELLHVLFEVEEISQTALQKKVNIDHAAVTRHLKQLEERGTVVRRKNPDDNRVTFVRLTEEGRGRLEGYCREKKRFIQNVLQGISEADRDHLADVLAHIQKNVKEIQ
ncbi:MarR family winged helix-turn-helix transcriptional regulator [Domibacillus robiginosus]|uniref:MarR family winged helix-turn-helix transcriptional regulator n=1 Tax=Domibacillus robiginosus TaxID=1071054 RepID=UPI00067ADDDF|nr:MarR family transcriptional regulator [Domibacillus robiginosus]